MSEPQRPRRSPVARGQRPRRSPVVHRSRRYVRSRGSLSTDRRVSFLSRAASSCRAPSAPCARRRRAARASSSGPDRGAFYANVLYCISPIGRLRFRFQHSIASPIN
eukprot:29954-Pelagococcus_subviridis.AAC.3